jgi:hypothetical protein
VGGTVTTLVSGALFAYSTRAVKHLDDQTMRLREDREKEREFERKQTLLDNVRNPELRDWIAANLIVGLQGDLADELGRIRRENFSGKASTSGEDGDGVRAENLP